MDIREILNHCDHTLLAQTATWEEIKAILDNDDIIAMVEDSPTYMRDKTTLTKIRTKAALEEEVATEEATDDNCVITF